MKKIIMMFLALIIIFNARNVLAQDQYKLTLEKQDGIYFSRRGVNFNDDSYPFYLYKFGDIFAYCIEPGKHISTYTYIGSDEFVDLDFSEELKEKLELIGYYGRDYPGHNTVRYSMATQALIWELTGVDTVTFWTKQNEKGEEIDVTKERNEIMELVNIHKTLPSFKTSYQGDLNQEMIIKDTNNVLDSYEIINDGNQDVQIKNNNLRIIPKTIGTHEIELRRKNYNEYKTIIFVGKGDNSTQKIARLHFTKEINYKLTINVDGINVLIHKVDENDNPIKLANIKFKIHDLTRNKDICLDNSSCFYQTNNKGEFIVKSLDYGEYEIEEVEDQIIPGYSWNSNKTHLVVDENTKFNYNDSLHNYLDLKIVNNSVQGFLEIKKLGEEVEYVDNTISYKEINLGNIKFDLYDVNDKYITSITTNESGLANFDKLKVGKYYLIENSPDNYIKLDKIPFEIKQDNQYQKEIKVNLTIKNYLKKGGLEFHKEDLVTSEGIPNTIIEIYDENDTLLFTKETDEEGMVIINELPIGKYYIIEKEANSLYKLTNEKVFFEILDNGEIVKAKMTNEKLEIKVPKTDTNEGVLANTLFLIIFLIGIGRMYYEKKTS